VRARFLADENIHADLVEWLRSRGHDVLYAAEVLSGAADEVLLAAASRENRILVTDDTDFGELVFRRRLASSGVLLIRLSSPHIDDRLRRLGDVWQAVEPQLSGRFVVLGDSKVRSRPIRLAGPGPR
jgi:predicted nuclease of predicted toxin-antitoxin system